MRRLAALFILFAAAPGLAQDAVDVRATVLNPDGKPAGGVDVWLITSRSMKPPYRVAAQTKTDAAGQFQFAKEVIDPLWKESIYPQVVARDAAGRIGSIYIIYPGSKHANTLKLRDTGEVRGRILDADGKPITGARIQPLRFAHAEADRGIALPLYLPREIATPYTATTGDDGRFVIRGVPTGDRLAADVHANRLAHVTIDWDTKTPCDVRMQPPATVSGRLTGGPPQERAGRELTLVSANQPDMIRPTGPLIVSREQSVKADGDGGFRFENFPPGRFELRATDTKVGPFYVEKKTLEIQAATAPPAFELPLLAARKLRGRVVDASSAGIGGVTVWLCRFVDHGGSFGKQVASYDSEAVSGPDGWYEGFVRPGEQAGVQIKTLPDDFMRKDSGQVMAENDPAASLRPLVVEKIEPIVVRVVDAAGKPVAGARVSATGPAHFFPKGPPKPTGADGVVKLPFADRSETATLGVVAGNAVSEPMPIDPAEERGPLTITVSPANAFRFQGHVVDRQGKPIEGAEVKVSRMVSHRSKRNPGIAGSGGEIETLSTNAEGRFAAGPFVPGDEYSISVRNAGYRQFESPQIKATKGASHDFGRITMPRVDAVVRGRVVDSAGSPLAGVRIINSGDAPTRIVTTSAAEGTFELRGLSEGLVHAVAFKDDYLPARIAIETGKSEVATLTMRRRSEGSNAPPPTGIDDEAVSAVAKQVLEKLWEWDEARKSPVDKRMIELMARLDRDLARRWSGKPEFDEPTIDKLVDFDLDEALAKLATQEAYDACREMKRLATRLMEKDPVKALRLAEEMAVKSRAADPRYRLFSMSDAGRLLIQLGRVDAGRKLVEDAAAQAEKLATSDQWSRYVRGHVASRLAPFDLPRAKRLLEGAANAYERSRFAAMCANGLAASDPKAAAEMLQLMDKSFNRALSAMNVAYLMAAKDPEAAARLVETAGEGSTHSVAGLGWVALAVAPRDKAAAHRLIDRGFQSIHDRRPEAMGWHFFGGWGEPAGALALYGMEIGHPDRASFAAHMFAARPTVADVHSELRVLEANVGLALLLAPVDMAAAKTLFDVAEARKDVIGGGKGGIRRREYLAALALIEPKHSLPTLLAEIEQLKTAARGLPDRGGLLDVLGLMTTPNADRRRAIARFLSVAWPNPEEFE